MRKGIEILVGLAMEYAFDREAYAGVAKCAQEHGDIFVSPKYGNRTFVEEAEHIRPDGLILSSSDPAVIDDVVSLGIPCVNVANYLQGHEKIPVIGTDDVAIGKMVAEHFVDRGFRHFAYFADAGVEYFHTRRDGFVSALRTLGYTCHVGPPAAAVARRGPRRTRVSPGWPDVSKHAGEWLASLPLPLGIMCPFDRYAREAIQTCKTIGLSVPGQVSVIGVDNDPLLCLSVSPSVSSVVPPAAEIGYQALQLLREMIDGRRPPTKPLLLPPVEIFERGSSGEMAISDPDVAAAVQFIRSHLRENLTVARLADEIAVARRTLERKFFEVLHRTPLQEIRRARIVHAKRLLLETELTLPEVARRSGMIRHQRLSNLIKCETGLTPKEFRKRFARR